jgi:hypothetical protein
MEDSVANINQPSTSTCCRSKFEYFRSRELDLNMTEDKLSQENEFLEKQRNLSISQRTHELQIVY